MTRRELIDCCLTYPGAYEDYPFNEDPSAPDAWTVMRHRTGKRSFAFIFERGGLCVNLKCEPAQSDFLRQACPGVTPAYHMNKVHWNTVRPDEVPEELLHELIDRSFRLTAAKQGGRPAPKKERRKETCPD